MRKYISLLLVAVLTCITFSAAFANDADLSAMSFEDLSTLKQKVDNEYNSRAEAEPFPLAEGQYLVGIDLAPGRYYMACVEAGDSGYTTRLHVYVDRAQHDSAPSGRYGEYLSDDYFGVGDEPKSVRLGEGNFLLLESGSLLISTTPFKSSDYIKYELPDGTLVPTGVYEVGENGEIPAGKYNAFAGTASGGDLKIYLTKEKFTSDGSWHLGYDQHYELNATRNPKGEGLVLEEGYIVLVEQDIIMKKQQKLSFD